MLTNDVISALKDKLNEYLSECALCEQSGVTFSGEAWAYRRMLNFVNSLPVSSAA